MKTVDEYALRGLHRLRHLALHLNYLRSAPSLIYICSSLESLDLSMNRICKITSSYFANCTKLTYLDLGDNCLNEVPHLLRISNEIQTFILSGNLITSVEALFENTLPFLTKLDIGDNLLSFWCFPPRSFWPNLAALNLRNNHISFVTEPFKYGRIFVTLDQNNFSCSSHLNWMRQCRTTKYHSNESRMICGNHDETILADVSFSCPGAQGRMKSIYSKFYTDPQSPNYVKEISKLREQVNHSSIYLGCNY